MAFENKFLPGCACCSKCEIKVDRGLLDQCGCAVCGDFAPVVLYIPGFYASKPVDEPLVFNFFGLSGISGSVTLTADSANPGTRNDPSVTHGSCLWHTSNGNQYANSLIKLAQAASPGEIFYYRLELNLSTRRLSLIHVVTGSPDLLTEAVYWDAVDSAIDCQKQNRFRLGAGIASDVFDAVAAGYLLRKSFCITPISSVCSCNHVAGFDPDVVKPCCLRNMELKVSVTSTPTPGCRSPGGDVQAGGFSCEKSGEWRISNSNNINNNSSCGSIRATLFHQSHVYSTYYLTLPHTSVYYLFVEAKYLKGSTCFFILDTSFEGLCDLNDNPIGLAVGAKIRGYCQSCIGYNLLGGSLYFNSPAHKQWHECLVCPGTDVDVTAAVTYCEPAPPTGTEDCHVPEVYPSISCLVFDWPAGDNSDRADLGVDRAAVGNRPGISSNYQAYTHQTSTEKFTSTTTVTSGFCPVGVTRTFTGTSPKADLHIEASYIYDRGHCENSGLGCVGLEVTARKRTFSAYPNVLLSVTYARATYTRRGLEDGTGDCLTFDFCTINGVHIQVAPFIYNYPYFQGTPDTLTVIPDSAFPPSITLYRDTSKTDIASNDGTKIYQNCAFKNDGYTVNVPDVTYSLNCSIFGNSINCAGTTTAATITLAVHSNSYTLNGYDNIQRCNPAVSNCGKYIPADVLTSTTPRGVLSVDGGRATLELTLITGICLNGGGLAGAASYTCSDFSEASGGTFNLTGIGGYGFFNFGLSFDFPATLTVT